jgi:DNA-3-methyladenine glycosylase
LGSVAPFPRERLSVDTETAARSLIGAHLVRGSGLQARIGRIVEVEAYVGVADLASHARFGRTSRNAVMFGPPGVAYVYLVYGMYNCLNVVTEPEGRPAAVLIRAVEPVSGVAEMRAARLERALLRADSHGPEAVTRARRAVAAVPDRRLAAGPGLVCSAFAIDRAMDGLDLCDVASPVHLETAADEPLPVETGPRVGIDYAPEPWRSTPWRFYVPGNPALSVTTAQARREAAR